MSGPEDSERPARVALSFLVQPGDPVLGAALRTTPAQDLLAAVSGADNDGQAVLSDQVPDPALGRAIARWRDRLGDLPDPAGLAAWQDSGMRVIVPGDAEWPTQLDDLGDARPLLLWVRGSADLRLTCVNSVSIVGSRAATGYGSHVAIEMAATLAERGVAIVSGGAYVTNSQLRATLQAGRMEGSGDLSYGQPLTTSPAGASAAVVDPRQRGRHGGCQQR